jgi:hypothetical protein
MRRKSIAVAGLAATFLAASLITAPAASAEELPSCRIWADAPVERNGTVIGTAHREGCAQNRKTITVRIREDFDFWPDTTLAERTWTNVVNDDFAVSWDCPREWEGIAFTEILTNAGGKSSSTRRELHCFS